MFHHIFQFEKSRKGKKPKPKVFIFGAGGYGKHFLPTIKQNYSVLGYLDNNASLYNRKINEIEVFSPNIVEQKEFDIIIIAININACDGLKIYISINKQLLLYGVEKSKIRHIDDIYNSEFYDNEDSSVLDLLDNLNKEHQYKLLEVGSGLCRFVDKINNQYPNIDITCFEINDDLADNARAKNFKVINENLLRNTLLSEEYDLVHCSHVVEHFKYPEIIFVIDELLRITKKDGFCIIRSPLLWEGFYDDIDHIRVYPPSSIINYLTMSQQQVHGSGSGKVKIISIWHRTSPKQYRPITKSSLLYLVPFIRYFWNKHLLKFINKISTYFWNKYRFPATEPNGYVMIMKKMT
jgi:hypothetical protein